MHKHQKEKLFHKSKAMMSFMFGGEADNHAVNTVPKECLIRVTKAEDGGLGGRGPWKPGLNGMAPGAENDKMKKYIAGNFSGKGEGGGATFE
jgi:nitrate reductase alpha subunit